MKANLIAIAAMAALSGVAHASSFSHLDRPDDSNLNNRAALSTDIYVTGFGWAWGEVRFQSESAAPLSDDHRGRGNEMRVQGRTGTTGTGAALYGGQGNVGANIGAGAGNAQSSGRAIPSATR